jgi:hypothetical protein
MNIGTLLSLSWDLAAFWFLASVVGVPVFLLVRRARARGKRLFVDGPTKRSKALQQIYTNDHYWD